MCYCKKIKIDKKRTIMLKKTRNYKGVSVLILVTLLLSLCSCGNRDKKVSKSGFYFDTIITITLYNTSDEKYIKAAKRAEFPFFHSFKVDSDMCISSSAMVACVSPNTAL